MTTSSIENQQTAQATLAASGAAQEPKATRKARAAVRSRHVAPAKGKSGKKTTHAKKGAQPPKKATSPKAETAKGEGIREGSKTAKVLDLLKRPGGATSRELMKATGWLPHSVRGFISGTVGKKMGLAVTSAKGEGGERTYSVKP